MADHKLKVYPKYRPLSLSMMGHFVPELRLCGQWLHRSGFKIGDRVQVIVNDQEIIIKHSEHGADPL
jgi:hypothetical protein